MRRAMASALWRFSTTRMLQEYTERLYLPAAGVETSGHGRSAGRHRGRLTTVPPRISLALALHNHQPVGNFGWVFAEVFEQAYEPMIAALERHPGVRLSLHYTGPLLEWLIAERPEAIDRLRALVDARPGRDPGRRLLRAGARVAARARPDRPADPDGRRARVDVRRRDRAARGWRSASGSRTCRRRSSRRATTGRSSTTRISAPRRSRRTTSGARTRPRTRATCCGCSGRSRACATGSRSARSTRSSTTCASTPPMPATGSA